jgi:hypothetical protein
MNPLLTLRCQIGTRVVMKARAHRLMEREVPGKDL